MEIDAVIESVIVNRESAWLGLTETIAGIEVKQFTPFHYAILNLNQSPFFEAGHELSRESILQFIWVVSTEYSGNLKKRDAFIKRNALLDYDRALIDILRFIKDAFIDGPKGSGIDGPPIPPMTGMSASIIHLLAHSYGWSIQEIIHIPFKCVFQLWKHIKLQNNPDSTIENPWDAAVVDALNTQQHEPNK